jgi:hypothetical protein
MRDLYVGEEFESGREDFEEDEDFMAEDWEGLDVIMCCLPICNVI